MKRRGSIVFFLVNVALWCGVFLGTVYAILLSPLVPSAPARDLGGESARVLLAANAAAGNPLGLALGGEVGNLVLQDLKLTFRIGEAPGGKTDLAFLERIPNIRRLEVRNAEVLLVREGTGQQVKLTGLTVTVSDFSPATGGSIEFQGRFAATVAGEATFAAKGTARGTFRIASATPRPSGRGAVELAVESATYAGGDRAVSLSDLWLAADLAYDRQTETVAVAALRVESKDLGTITGSATAVLRDEMPWRADLSAASIDFSKLLATVRAFLPEAYRPWTAQGTGTVEARAEGALEDGRPVFAGRLNLSFAQGGFSSPDGTRAAQGANGTLALQAARVASARTVAFDVRAEQRDGEYLWGGYYTNLAGRRASLTMVGDYALGDGGSFDARGTLDLFQTGDYSFRAHGQGAEWALRLNGANISHARIVETLLKEYLAGLSADLARLSVTGSSFLDATVRNEGDGLAVTGTYKTDGASLAVPDNRLSIREVAAVVPFTLRYPSTGVPVRASAPSGFVRFRTVQSGGVAVESLTVPLIVSDSRLDVPEPIAVPFFGGQVRLYGLQVDDVLYPTRYRFGVKVDDVDLGLMTRGLFGVEYPGAVNADLGMMRYENNRIVSEGRAVVNVFGGEIEATDLFAENIPSAARKFGGDIAFRGISLEALTQKIAVGKMSGIVQGSLKNFVMEYGEPASFVLHVESVERRGVAQSISTDAIQNISILGTGVDNPLNQGITRFFREYPYSKIGLRCVLKNDRFSVNGTIREGGKEYLVRRGLLRGVDVINQNPDNVISFRDMQERLERIFRTTEVEPGGIRVE
jgi:hypothetical protein